MSIEILKPGEAIPYTEKQLNDLCLPETGITPGDFIERGDSYGIFYVNKEGVLLGVAFCSVKGKGNGKFMRLYVLCVSEAARGLRIGSAILKAVDDLTRSLGLRAITLSAIARQRNFYKNNGFVEKGPDDEDGEYYGMVKVLPVGGRRKKTRRCTSRRAWFSSRRATRGRRRRNCVL